jgi:hypothetical protein
MSPIVRLSCAALCVAAVLLGPSTPPTRAADGDLPEVLDREFDKQIDQIVKDHRTAVGKAMKGFRRAARALRRDMKGGEKASIPSQTAGALNLLFRDLVSATRAGIEQIESQTADVFAAHESLPDQVAALSADPGSRIAAAVAQINDSNGKASSRIRRALAGLQKHADNAEVPLHCIVRGMPTFLTPQTERSGSFGSGMTTASVHILVTVAGAFRSGTETFRTFEVLGYSDPPKSGNTRQPRVGLFEPDGAQVGVSFASIAPTGMFRGSFSGVPAGVKVVAVDLFDKTNDDPASIFADGFESADAAAWSSTVP